MSDVDFMKGMLVVPFHIRNEVAASPNRLAAPLVKSDEDGSWVHGGGAPARPRKPSYGKRLKGFQKLGPKRPVTPAPAAPQGVARSIEGDDLHKSTTHTQEQVMSEQFEDIFKGMPTSKSKGSAPKPVAAQKRASRPGNEADPKRGKKGGQAPTPVRGGMKGGAVESREMGGRPKAEPSTKQTGTKVRKSFPVTADTSFRAVDYVMDGDPNASQA